MNTLAMLRKGETFKCIDTWRGLLFMKAGDGASEEVYDPNVIILGGSWSAWGPGDVIHLEEDTKVEIVKTQIIRC